MQQSIRRDAVMNSTIVKAESVLFVSSWDMQKVARHEQNTS